MSKHLSPNQVAKFDFLIKGTGTSWNVIAANDLAQYSWDDLINKTKFFIEENLPLYRSAIEYVWNESPKELFNQVAAPKLPKVFQKRLPHFESGNFSESINFEKQSKTAKRIGNLGESFVIELEKKRLLKLGINDLIPKKVMDGEGYDIKSFDKNRNDKFIEVKTTVGGASPPFHISSNEVAFFKKYNSSALIYRVYDFNPKDNSGNFFIINYAYFEKLNVQPQEFKVFFK